MATPITGVANISATGALLTLTIPTGTARTFTVRAWDALASGTPLAIPASAKVISWGDAIMDVYPGTNAISINLNGVPTKIFITGNNTANNSVTPPTVSVTVPNATTGVGAPGTTAQFQALDADGFYLTGAMFTVTDSGAGGFSCILNFTANVGAGASTTPGPITSATPTLTGSPATCGANFHEGDLIAVTGNSNDAVLQVVTLSNPVGSPAIGGIGSVAVLYGGTGYYNSGHGSGLYVHLVANASGIITSATVSAAFSGPGNGYAVGDVVDVGSQRTGKVMVATINPATGAVLTVTLLNGGSGYITGDWQTYPTDTAMAVSSFHTVEWKVNGSPAGVSTPSGRIDPYGNYTPPTSMPSTSTYTITVVSTLTTPPPSFAYRHRHPCTAVRRSGRPIRRRLAGRAGNPPGG